MKTTKNVPAKKLSHSAQKIADHTAANPKMTDALATCPRDARTIAWAREFYLLIGYRGIGEIIVSLGDKKV